MQEGEHKEVMLAAVADEAAGHRALLAGDLAGAHDAYARAADAYRRSWELAPPASYGRLVGRMKAAVLADLAEDAAADVLDILRDDPATATSPAAAYAQAVAALVAGEDDTAVAATDVMHPASAAFGRAADGIRAIAALDDAALRATLAAIEEDFAQRSEHLSGVAVADTAVMLAALAEHRGLGEADAGGPLRPAWRPR